MFSTPQAAVAPPAKAALPPLQGAAGKPACARRLEPSQPEAPARQHAAGVSVLAVCSLLLLCPTGFGPIVWGPFSAAFFLAPASKEFALQLDPERGGAAAVKTADEMAAEAESLRKVHAEEADPVDYKTAEHAAGCAATEGATPDAAPEGFTPAALLFDVFAGGTSTSAGGGCPAFSVGDRVIRSRDGAEGTVETVEPDGKIKVRAADGSLLNRATSSSWRLSHSEDGTGPKPAPNDEWPKEGTHEFRTLRGVECLLDPMTGEEAQMWKLLIDKEIMKPFEDALDDFSLWRAGAGYVSRTIEGVAILSNHNEDAVAAIGPDSRANAAGAESWLLRVEKIPKLGELVVKHGLRALNEQVRMLLPSGKSRFAGFRQKYWHLGDMLRLADRWMRFAKKYTMLEVENARARCTFGKEGTLSAALGPHYKKQHKQDSRAGSREQGRAAREPWEMMYGKPTGKRKGQPGTNVENVIAKTFILRIFNQDPTVVRMELKGEGLSYNRHMLDSTDPKTIMGFARVFYMSLHGKAPTVTWLNNLRKNLRNNANSALFEGYGWEMEFGGQKWEKKLGEAKVGRGACHDDTSAT